MSSYYAEFKNKKTGHIARVLCWDDYFGRHKYGYVFNDDTVLTEDEMSEQYRRVEYVSSGT